MGAGVLVFAAVFAFVFSRYQQRRAARRAAEGVSGGHSVQQDAMHKTQGMAMTPTAASPAAADKGCLARDTMAAGWEAGELDSGNEVYELPPGRQVAELADHGRGT